MARLSLILAATLLTAPGTAFALQGGGVNLPAGRLGDSVIALGRQAGISIGISDPSLVGRRVRAVRGNLSPERALAEMLRGSGASFVRVDARTFRIVRAAAQPVPTPPPLRRAVITRAVDLGPPPPAETGPDIVVTAARRPATLGTYPASLDIVSGDDPEFNRGLGGNDMLVARLPGVSSTHLGPGRNKVFIRGMADSSFNGPTQATTGRYLGETRITYTTPDPDLRLFDLDRVEVLRGPQGTLYGAGSLGGIVRLIPRAPQLQAVEGRVQAGVTAISHGEPGFDAAGVINLPIIADTLGFRAVAYGSREGGYIDDPFRALEDVNRVEVAGGRAALRLATPSGWTIDLGVAGQTIRGRDSQSADDPALVPAGQPVIPPLTRRSAIAQPYRSDYLLADLVVTRDWETVRLVSSIGFVRQKSEERFDSTGAGPITGDPGGPATMPAFARLPVQVFDQATDVTMISAETRLSGGSAGGTSWLAGISLLSNALEQRRAAGDPNLPLPLPGVSNRTREGALFGEVSFRPAPRVTITAGARISYSDLAGGSLDIAVPLLSVFGRMVASAQREQVAFLPSAAIAYEAAPDLLLFARYQEGFRPGGLGVIGNAVQAFRGDSVRTFETGLRHVRPDRRLTAQASLAYTRWTDIQADTISITGFPITANIGDGQVYTADLSLAWRPLPGLNVEVAGVLNHSEVTNPLPGIGLVSGFSLPNVADLGGRASVDYATDLGPDMALTLSGVARYTGASRLGAGAILGREQGELVELSMAGRIERGAHAVTFSLTNLLDQTGNRFAMGSPFTLISNPQITPLRPRAIRVGWEVRF